MERYLLIVLLVLSPLAQSAGEMKDKGDARNLTNEVMEIVGKGGFMDGIARMRPHTLLPLDEWDETVVNMDEQRQTVKERYGEVIGHEYLGEKSIGESLLEFTYLLKLENSALVWRFLFYNPGSRWFVHTFNVDSSSRALFSQYKLEKD